jgi:hypothetical protein
MSAGDARLLSMAHQETGISLVVAASSLAVTDEQAICALACLLRDATRYLAIPPFCARI